MSYSMDSVSKRKTYICKSIVIQLWGVSRYFSKYCGQGLVQLSWFPRLSQDFLEILLQFVCYSCHSLPSQSANLFVLFVVADSKALFSNLFNASFKHELTSWFGVRLHPQSPVSTHKGVDRVVASLCTWISWIWSPGRWRPMIEFLRFPMA